MAQLHADRATGAVLIDYVYSGSRMIAKVASGTTQYFLSDRLSVRLSLDSSGNITGRQGHLPFGEDFGESGTQEKHHFTSYETDPETSSDYAINRQYIQNVGRFMRVDPKAGSASSPVSLNRYSYVINDPINASDPFGLEYDPVNCWSISFLNPEVFYICGPREDLKGIGGGGATNGDPRTGGGGQVGTPAPLPDNLRARLRRLMQKNNNECGNFIQNLINQVASDTNRPLYSDYFMDLFDRIAGPEGGGYVVEPVVINGRSAGGSVRGDMGNAPTVLISPVPYSGYADDSYTHTAVHETIHLAPTQGWYLDGQLANAAFKLEGANLSQAEKDEYDQIEGDEWKASGFWDRILWKHCK